MNVMLHSNEVQMPIVQSKLNFYNANSAVEA